MSLFHDGDGLEFDAVNGEFQTVFSHVKPVIAAHRADVHAAGELDQRIFTTVTELAEALDPRRAAEAEKCDQCIDKGDEQAESPILPGHAPVFVPDRQGFAQQGDGFIKHQQNEADGGDGKNKRQFTHARSSR